jgi:hypothetical protein
MALNDWKKIGAGMNKSVIFENINTRDRIAVEKAYRPHKSNDWFVITPAKSGKGVPQLIWKHGDVEKVWLPEASAYQYQGFKSKPQALKFAKKEIMKVI